MASWLDRALEIGRTVWHHKVLTEPGNVYGRAAMGVASFGTPLFQPIQYATRRWGARRTLRGIAAIAAPIAGAAVLGSGMSKIAAYKEALRGPGQSTGGFTNVGKRIAAGTQSIARSVGRSALTRSINRALPPRRKRKTPAQKVARGINQRISRKGSPRRAAPRRKRRMTAKQMQYFGKGATATKRRTPRKRTRR